MALLDLDGELARSTEQTPFSNGYEFDCWSSIWCHECVREPDCPLLLVILHERTPGPWVERDPAALNRYTCREFQARTRLRIEDHPLRPAVPTEES